jgi:hypothetical protein
LKEQTPAGKEETRRCDEGKEGEDAWKPSHEQTGIDCLHRQNNLAYSPLQRAAPFGKQLPLYRQINTKIIAIMRITTTQIALLALPALIHARSVALMDFVPRVSDVSGTCDEVYRQSIPGCESTDFTQKGCSVKCIKGLDSMTHLIKEACGNDGLLDRDDKSNVLAVFLKGNGPQGLCTNADEVLQSQHTSTATPTSLDTPTKHSSKSGQPTTTIVSSTKTAASSTNVPTSLVVDTSSSPEPTESASSTSSAESSDTASITTVTESSQIFEAPSMPASWPSTSASSKPTESAGHSGGGSPFDAEGNEFSAAAATSSSTIALFLAVVFAGLAAHW